MAEWIKAWIWRKSDAWLESHPTILAFDRDDPDRLLGFGTWSIVEARSSAGLTEPHIEIAWFGVHKDYQAQEAEAGFSCADRLYSTIVADARENSPNGGSMPITLVCEVGNDRGRKFWKKCGFGDLEDVAEQPPDGTPKRYQRMLLGSLPNPEK